MAKYRQVHTTFWDDGFVVDLTPEEKYFYLYLMTNNNTTQCGIYELPYRIIEMQTGYNRDTVLKLLDRFIEYGKIQYNEQTKEIILTNWGKYNFINSPKVKKCIKKELKEIKHKPFITEYMNSLKKYGIDTLSIDYREEEEKEQEKEQEEEQEQQQQERKVDVDFSKLINFYEQNIGQISPILSQKLGDLVDTHNINLIIEAFTRAITAQASNKFSYADKILKSWTEKNINSLEQLKASEVKHNAKHERTSEPTAYDNLCG